MLNFGYQQLIANVVNNPPVREVTTKTLEHLLNIDHEHQFSQLVKQNPNVPLPWKVLLTKGSGSLWRGLIEGSFFKNPFHEYVYEFEREFDDNCTEEVAVVFAEHGFFRDMKKLSWAIQKDYWQVAEKLVLQGVGLKYYNGYGYENYAAAWEKAVTKDLPWTEILFEISPKLEEDYEFKQILKNASEGLLTKLYRKSYFTVDTVYNLALEKGFVNLFLEIWEKHPIVLKTEHLARAITSGKEELYRLLLNLGAPYDKHLLSYPGICKEVFKDLLKRMETIDSSAYHGLEELSISDEECAVVVKEMLAKKGLPENWAIEAIAKNNWIKTLDVLYKNGVSLNSLRLSQIPKAKHEEVVRYLFVEGRGRLSLEDVVETPSSRKSIDQDIFSGFYNRALNMFPYSLPDQEKRRVLETILLFCKKHEFNIFDIEPYLQKVIFSHYKNNFPLEKALLYHHTWYKEVWKFLYPEAVNLTNLRFENPYGFKLDLFQSLLPEMKKASRQEGNQNAEINAYKLSVLFDNKQEAADYLEGYRKQHPHCQQPVHDACLFTLPHGVWDIATWKKKLISNKWSSGFVQLIPRFADLEEMINGSLTPYQSILCKLPPTLSDQEKDTAILRYYAQEIFEDFANVFKDNQEVVEELGSSQISSFNGASWKKLSGSLKRIVWEWVKQAYANDYKLMKGDSTRENWDRAMPMAHFIKKIAENRNIASLSFKHLCGLVVEKLFGEFPERWHSFIVKTAIFGLSKQNIEDIIDFIDKRPKLVDFVPDLSITDPTGYVIETMSPLDPFVLVAGALTGCCQSIHSGGRDVAIHAASSPFGRILRVMKGNTWIAQGWIGVTKELELVIDSIEPNSGHSTEMILKLYQQAASLYLKEHPYFKRVLLGGGGGTKNLKPKVHLKNFEGKISPILGYKGGGYDSKDSRYILAEQAQPAENMASFRPYVLVPAVDSYVHRGKKIKTLALDFRDRARLEKEAPDALAFLRQNLSNPVAEEGFYDNHVEREFHGELFLTHQALELLIEKKIKGKKGIDPRYNFDRVIMVKDSTKDFLRILSEKPIQEDLPTLIIMTGGNHTIAGIVGRVGNRIVAFVSDSEGDAHQNCPIAGSLKKAYPDASVICNGILLQKDHYSCTTMALKNAIFFAKQGRALLRTLAQRHAIGQMYDICNLNELPPALLKLAQGVEAESLSEASKNTIVSHKRGLTLEQYLVHYSMGKLNSAALEKKTKFTRLLQSCLQR